MQVGSPGVQQFPGNSSFKNGLFCGVMWRWCFDEAIIALFGINLIVLVTHYYLPVNIDSIKERFFEWSLAKASENS